MTPLIAAHVCTDSAFEISISQRMMMTISSTPTTRAVSRPRTAATVTCSVPMTSSVVHKAFGAQWVHVDLYSVIS